MTVPEILYQRAIDAGFTVPAACALLAMIEGESAFRSDNAEDRINRVVSDDEYIRRADNDLPTYNGKSFIYDEVGFGYAQWTFWSRKKFLLEFCRGRGVSVADHEAQKEFIFVEMQRDFPTIWDLCRTSYDLSCLTKMLINVWENPADHDGAYKVRYPYAQAWYSKFNGWTAPSEIKPEPEPIDDIVSEPVDDEGLVIPKTWPPRMIQNGLNWPETYLLQSLLRCHGYNVLVSGVFADSLDRKVREFQEDNKLKVDGVVGSKTWRKLFELPSNF